MLNDIKAPARRQDFHTRARVQYILDRREGHSTANVAAALMEIGVPTSRAMEKLDGRAA